MRSCASVAGKVGDRGRGERERGEGRGERGEGGVLGLMMSYRIVARPPRQGVSTKFRDTPSRVVQLGKKLT